MAFLDRKRSLSSLAVSIIGMASSHGCEFPPGVGIRHKPRTMADTMRRIPPRPARNHPCPCGSGRKFKKCCDPNRKD